MISSLVLTQLAVFAATLVYASFSEWTLHRFFMHRRFPLLVYPYLKHALSHHVLYDGGRHYEHSERDPGGQHVTFTAFDYLLVVCFHGALSLAVEWLSGLVVAPGVLLGVLAYVQAFNSAHYRWHCPSGAWFERTRIWRWAKERHRIHHERQRMNYNLVIPIADIVLGTYEAPKVRTST